MFSKDLKNTLLSLNLVSWKCAESAPAKVDAQQFGIAWNQVKSLFKDLIQLSINYLMMRYSFESPGEIEFENTQRIKVKHVPHQMHLFRQMQTQYLSSKKRRNNSLVLELESLLMSSIVPPPRGDVSTLLRTIQRIKNQNQRKFWKSNFVTDWGRPKNQE